MALNVAGEVSCGTPVFEFQECKVPGFGEQAGGQRSGAVDQTAATKLSRMIATGTSDDVIRDSWAGRAYQGYQPIVGELESILRTERGCV